MLKGKLKEALKKAGLSEELAEAINITNESQIEGIVIALSTQNTETDFTQILGSSEFSEFISTNGFDNVIKLSKALQSAHDKKVTAGINTFKDKYKNLLDPPADPPADPDNKANAALVAMIGKLNDKIDNLEKSRSTETKMDQAKAVINGSKVLTDTLKEKWINRIDLESETSFDDQLKELETEYSDLHKHIAGEGAGNGLPTGGTGGDKEMSDEEAQRIVDNVF